jgi:hypothetical protein
MPWVWMTYASRFASSFWNQNKEKEQYKGKYEDTADPNTTTLRSLQRLLLCSKEEDENSLKG